MRASVASLSKKFLSTFFAATLALGMVPAAAFAAPENATIAANETTEEESPNSVISTEASESERSGEIFSEEVIHDDSVADASASAPEVDPIDDNATTGDDSNLSIPAALERINEDVALTQPVAQQESTRSYFLAQTLESTKTVPIVSANLPLDKGTSADEVAESGTEGEGSVASEDEGGEDSDESDLPTSNIVAADSTVIGSFEYQGIVYAMEPGGETVAAVAADYAKLPAESIEVRTIVLPSMVPMTSAYGIDFFSVTRIADYAFATLSRAENPITVLGIPSSIIEIGENTFSDFDTLEYIVVEEGNPTYASYDGALYSADLTNLRLIPEGRVGTIRVAPSATTVEPEAFSHCPSVDTVVADPESEAYASLEELLAQNSIMLEAASVDVYSSTDPTYSLVFGEESVLPENLGKTAISLNSSISYGVDWNEAYAQLSVVSSTNTYYYSLKSLYDDTNAVKDGVEKTGSYAKPSTFDYDVIYDLDVYFSNGCVKFDVSSRVGNKNAYTAEFGLTRTKSGSIYKLGGVKKFCFRYQSLTDGHTVKGYNVEGSNRYIEWSEIKNALGNEYGAMVLFLDAAGGDVRNRTLNWDANGGTVNQSTTSSGCGSKFDVPTATRAGYQFTGWYTDLTNGTQLPVDNTGQAITPTVPLTSGQALAAADTYYAHWEKKPSLSVTLDKNGGSGGTSTVYYWPEQGYTTSYTSIDVVSAGEAFIPTFPSNSGREFAGYYSAKTGGIPYVDKDGKLTSNAPSLTTSTTWYAHWTKKASHTVTLDKNDGTGGTDYVYYWPEKGYTTGLDSETVISVGSKLVTEAPTLAGRNFAGYYSAKTGGTQYTYSNGNLTSNAPVLTEGKTWYAHWSKKTSLIVTLDKNGGSGGTNYVYYWPDKGYTTSSSSEAVISAGSNLVAYAPTLSGRNFAGYYSEKTGGTRYADEKGNLTSNAPTLSSGTTWYAQYTKKDSYAVTLNKNGGSGGTDYVYYWPDKGYTTSADSETVIAAGSKIIAEPPSLAGYNFAGYYSALSGGTQYADVSGNLTSNAPALSSGTTWYAQYTKKDSYTVTLNKNGGSGGTDYIYYWPDQGYTTSSDSTSVIPAGTVIVSSFPTWDGRDFAGYYSDPKNGTKYIDAEGKLAAAAPALSSDTTFYAHWTNATYSITWEMKGHGLEQKPSKTSYTFTDTYNLPGISDVIGWKFGGWFTDDNCTVPASNIDSTTYGPKTFYAKWTHQTYAIEWDMKGHGEEQKPTKTSYEYEESYALPPISNVTGWTFTGWYTDSNCTSRASNITSGDYGAKKFYAGWSLNSHTVYWHYDGAANKTDGYEDKSYGSLFTMREPGSKAGYKFAGWQASGAASGTYAEGDAFTMVDGEVHFTVQWSRLPYVTVNLADTRLSEGVGAVYYWPERGYVDASDSTSVREIGQQITTRPAVSGYEFLGWYDVQDQNENSDSHKMIDAYGNVNTAYAPNATVTWYAHWKRVSCPIVLVADYDSIPYVTDLGDRSIPFAAFEKPLSASIAEGGKLKVTPTRDGYTFMGYYTKKNPEVTTAASARNEFEGKQWIDGEGRLSNDVWNVYPTEERAAITLYAAWRLDDCLVTFDAKGNLLPNTERVVVANEDALPERIWNYGKPKGSFTVPADDTFYRNGYSFEGWYFLDGDSKVFVSDSFGNPTPANWYEVKTSVTLYPGWIAKEYTLLFDVNYPDVAGMTTETPKPTEVKTAYDNTLDISALAPEFMPFTFQGWYTETDQAFEGMHMTVSSDGTKRFTPRDPLVGQNPIRLHALWTEPGKATYTLYVGAPDGTALVSESPHAFSYLETVVFNGTEAPAPVDGYRFVGWVSASSDADARRIVREGGPAEDADTTPGFGPLVMRNLFFVAKWVPVELSTTLLAKPAGDDSAWLLATDVLKDYDKDVSYEGDVEPMAWSEACDELDVLDPAKARFLYYDVTQAPFVLPDVVRKGQVFEGWKLHGSPDAPERGLVVYPSSQPGSAEMRDLVYVPVFKDAMYTIVLDGTGLAENTVVTDKPYSGEFAFPYPKTLATGSAFVCWASDDNTDSDATKRFFPDDVAKLAPVYDEVGNVTEDGFGLAQLDEDGDNMITLYAVWNRMYNVEVPLFANLAIDTEQGDVIAGTNTLHPANLDDEKAVYQVESIRYEPMFTNGNVAFQGAKDKVYLSVYAGLNTSEETTDLEHLLYAENIDKDGGTDGEVTYTDAKGNTAKAKPLLIELGGDSAVLYKRVAPEGQASLESVTDKTAPYGFVTFGLNNPLTIRYGLYFENPQTRKDFAANSDKYDWLLPRNDASNKLTSEDPEHEDYGRRTTWSSDAVNIARLYYTVSVSNTK